MSLSTCFARPRAALALALATALLPLHTPPAARAQSLAGVKVTVLHTATYPSTLTVGPDGSLWGTTDDYYHSTLFKVTLGGLFHPLIEFSGTNALSGNADPGLNLPPGFRQTKGPLLLLPNGSFFGGRLYGGTAGMGGLFQFTPTRRYQVKHLFAPVDSQQINVRGAYPILPMARGLDGAIYGVTARGGSIGGGVLFRDTAANGVEVLHEFPEPPYYTGAGNNGVIVGPDGAIYGTTGFGGSGEGGTIYRMTTAGEYTVLHTFINAPDRPDGFRPTGAPVVGPDGALYGTTYDGGDIVVRGSHRYHGDGTVYRVTPEGDFSTIYTFASVDVAHSPLADLVLGPDDKLYGKSRSGAVFRVTTDGKLTVLLSNAHQDLDIGGNTQAGLVFGRDNRLYASGETAIYKITVPF